MKLNAENCNIMSHKQADDDIAQAMRRIVMYEYDDKRGDCEDNILINAEIEDEAEAKQEQDDEDLFDLFILNEFFDLQGQGNNWNNEGKNLNILVYRGIMKVITIWECEIKKDLKSVVEKIILFMEAEG